MNETESLRYIYNQLNIGKPAHSTGDNATNVSQCLTVNNLNEIILPDGALKDWEKILENLCPVVLQQAISGNCKRHDHSANDPAINFTVFGYAFAAVTAVSLCALIGIVIKPLMNTSGYQYTMVFLLCCAVSTLVGDAIIHLMPEVLGAHKHDSATESEEEDHDHASDHDYLLKCISMCIAIYVFFVINSLSLLGNFGHGHSHGGGSEHQPNSHMSPRSSKEKIVTKDEDDNELDNGGFQGSTTNTTTLPAASYETFAHKREGSRAKLLSPRIQTAFRLLLGGSLHNFADGIAIGAAFAFRTDAGVSTSLAILFHEIPHEFGDIAMLLSLGLTMKMALLLNLLTAIVAFIGVTAGVFLSANEMIRIWILAFTAGTFIYIGLVDVLYAVKGYVLPRPWLQFLLMNLGMLLGFGVMIVIALFEDSLKW